LENVSHEKMELRASWREVENQKPKSEMSVFLRRTRGEGVRKRIGKFKKERGGGLEAVTVERSEDVFSVVRSSAESNQEPVMKARA
jgi:hypothetical protein